ncbi:hypothetical protein FNU76_19350 [Chitinimonas arctica]|uniref:Uncharacterized protein n=1 Tax=Chitinimonas arctica TaxID=2594795 RepID=A0A516SJM1_9NEIS|nr:hypothetical protein [Chitinimonas arctica]QDQ28333.1 hypothetical protein FNU76_19350 [Chitinimonas arctica]
MFKVYLRDADKLISEKTLTLDAQAALRAFETLVNRAELDGQNFWAVLSLDGIPLAQHKFDTSPKSAMYFWRGRINHLAQNTALAGHA